MSTNHFTFRIGSDTHRLKTFGDLISTCTIPEFEGLVFDAVLYRLEKAGIELIPQLDEEQSFEFGKYHYRMLWRGGKLVYIERTLEDETKEITWKELPDDLKEIL